MSHYIEFILKELRLQGANKTYDSLMNMEIKVDDVGVKNGVNGINLGVNDDNQNDEKTDSFEDLHKDKFDERMHILSELLTNPGMTINDLVENTGISRRNIDRHISDMKLEGLLVRTGSTRIGQWTVMNKGDTNGGINGGINGGNQNNEKSNNSDILPNKFN